MMAVMTKWMSKYVTDLLLSVQKLHKCDEALQIRNKIESDSFLL